MLHYEEWYRFIAAMVTELHSGQGHSRFRFQQFHIQNEYHKNFIKKFQLTELLKIVQCSGWIKSIRKITFW